MFGRQLDGCYNSGHGSSPSPPEPEPGHRSNWKTVGRSVNNSEEFEKVYLFCKESKGNGQV